VRTSASEVAPLVRTRQSSDCGLFYGQALDIHITTFLLDVLI